MVKRKVIPKDSRKMNVQRIGVLSFANIVALIYLVLSPVYFILLLSSGQVSYGSFLVGLGAFVQLVLVLTISAWISTALVVLLYNLFSKRTGGVEVFLR